MLVHHKLTDFIFNWICFPQVINATLLRMVQKHNCQGGKKALCINTSAMTQIWNRKTAILRVGTGFYCFTVYDLLYIVVVFLTVNCVLF